MDNISIGPFSIKTKTADEARRLKTEMMDELRPHLEKLEAYKEANPLVNMQFHWAGFSIEHEE